MVEVPRHVDKVRSAGFQRASWQGPMLSCFEFLGSLQVTFEIHNNISVMMLLPLVRGVT